MVVALLFIIFTMSRMAQEPTDRVSSRGSLIIKWSEPDEKPRSEDVASACVKPSRSMSENDWSLALVGRGNFSRMLKLSDPETNVASFTAVSSKLIKLQTHVTSSDP